MSATPSHPERAARKPVRVLACVLCQQRKVKCDHKFPCGNCIRAQAQCIPATSLPARPRRRRFPERELLSRLHHYEGLLRQNNIKFEPLHKDHPALEKEVSATVKASNSPDDDHPGAATSGEQSSSPATTVKSETPAKARSIWQAMNHRAQDSDEDSVDSSDDDVQEIVIKKAWDYLQLNNDHLLFGSRRPDVDLSTLHPEQIHIFKLWQIYLDNVNPLLKVTHTPTLQSRIIDAASSVTNVKPALAALMFGIYCISILSLDDSQCRTLFGPPKDDLLKRYQLACQQALLKCEFLRTRDRDCLTALYLYLLSVRPDTEPDSLSSILGIAVRVAQRMGLHTESANARHPPLEAEMRRRLWWSLILFDTRMCEMADYKAAMLIPTWDCRVPLNVNDFDLQPEMKEPPAVQGKSTEALFAVVRSEIGEFVRDSAFQLDFISPALRNIVKDNQRSLNADGSEVAMLEKTIEDKYLKVCNLDNPLHFVTFWMTRGTLAKSSLLEHYARFPNSSVHQTDAQRNVALEYALSMLVCDTKLHTSQLVQGFRWFVYFYFPFPAYIHICQDLRRRPLCALAEGAWTVLNDTFEGHFRRLGQGDNPFFNVLTRVVLQAWDAREAALKSSDAESTPIVPPLINEIRRKRAQDEQFPEETSKHPPLHIGELRMDDDLPTTATMPVPMSMDFDGLDALWQSHDAFGAFPTQVQVHGQDVGVPDMDVNQLGLDWSTMNWAPVQGMHGFTW